MADESQVSQVVLNTAAGNDEQTTSVAIVESVEIGITSTDSSSSLVHPHQCDCYETRAKKADTPLLPQHALCTASETSSKGSGDCESNYTMSGVNLARQYDQCYPFSSQASGASSWGTPAQFKRGKAIISYDMTPFSSTTSSLTPVCRICQCPSEPYNILIHPCRCDGSLRFIHGTCLRKWIEVSSRKAKTTGPACCELCGFTYRKRKYIKCRNWQCPKVNVRDKILHSVFLVSIVVMVGCAIATVMCFITDKEQLAKYKSEIGERNHLTMEEIITLSCGITFFVSFFVAMSVEIKAKRTVYQIFRRCLRYNTVWIIENYSPPDNELTCADDTKDDSQTISLA